MPLVEIVLNLRKRPPKAFLTSFLVWAGFHIPASLESSPADAAARPAHTGPTESNVWNLTRSNSKASLPFGGRGTLYCSQSWTISLRDMPHCSDSCVMGFCQRAMIWNWGLRGGSKKKVRPRAVSSPLRIHWVSPVGFREDCVSPGGFSPLVCQSVCCGKTIA